MRLISRMSLLLVVSLTMVIPACTFGQQLKRIQTYPNWKVEADRITVVGNYVFMATWYEGVFVFDVTNSAAPVKIDLETPIEGVPVAADKHYVYTVASDYTLHTVDISDLSNPVTLGSYKPDTPTIDVAIQSPYIFLTTGAGGLHIIDASDPTDLQKVGIYDATIAKSEVTVRDVVVSEKYAYITLNDYTGQGFVEVLDTSNPTMPLKVGAVRVDLAGEIVIKGDYAFVTNGIGLQILDISNPSSPTIIASYDTPNFAQGLKIEGNYVYINDLFGVEVVDVSNPRSPHRIAYTKLPQVQDIAVVNGYIYVADTERGLVIYERP